jgi:ankyrin repeat protein
MLLKNRDFAVAVLAVLAPCCAAHAALRPGVVAAQVAGSADKQAKLNERLFRAVTKLPRDVPAVEAALKAGANVNSKSTENKTPLHLAAEKGQAEVVAVLLKAGADVNAKRESSDLIGDLKTPPRRPSNQGEALAHFVRVGQMNDGTSPLHSASAGGHAEVATVLLKAGAEVNANDNGGRTPLHAAATGGRADVVTVLLKAGAEVNARAGDGTTPLHYATTAEVASALLRMSAEVNAKDKSGRTPLHLAAGLGHAEVGTVLLKAGAAVEAKTSAGWTPLHLAAEKGQAEVVAVLLKAGANPRATDGAGKTPHALAKDEKCRELLWNAMMETPLK